MRTYADLTIWKHAVTYLHELYECYSKIVAVFSNERRLTPAETLVSQQLYRGEHCSPKRSDAIDGAWNYEGRQWPEKVNASIYLSISFSSYLSISVGSYLSCSIFISASLFVYLSLYVFMYLYIYNLSRCFFISSLFASIYLSIYLIHSISYLSIYLSILNDFSSYSPLGKLSRVVRSTGSFKKKLKFFCIFETWGFRNKWLIKIFTFLWNGKWVKLLKRLIIFIKPLHSGRIWHKVNFFKRSLTGLNSEFSFS